MTSDGIPSRATGARWAWALSVCLLATALAPGLHAFDRQLGVGAGGGFYQLQRRQISDPAAAYGGGTSLRLSYGLNDTFGVAAEIGAAWFGSYTPIVPIDATDEDGNPITTYLRGEPIDSLAVYDLALSLVYAIDVTRAVPYLAVGSISTRVSETRGDADVVDYEVGLRAEIGADITLVEHLTAGVAARLDTYFTDNSAYSGAVSIFLRLSFVWDLAELGHNNQTH